MNALQGIERLLSNSSKIRSMCRQVAADRSVKKLGLKPTDKQIHQFFSLFADGIRYAAATYGVSAVPTQIQFVRDHIDERGIRSRFVVGYMGELDLVLISHDFIARRCSQFGNGIFYLDSHLPGLSVTAEDRTFLQALEECYHRHQSVGLGYVQTETTHDRAHPHEVEVHAVWREAIAAKGIETRPADDSPVWSPPN